MKQCIYQEKLVSFNLSLRERQSIFQCYSIPSPCYIFFPLTTNTDIDDTVTDSSDMVRFYKFDTLADVMRYWTELEYISLAKIIIDDEEVPCGLVFSY